MSKQIISTKQAPQAIGPYNQAVMQDGSGLLFCSGQIALDPETMKLVGADAARQTHQVIKNLRAVLNKAGMDLSNVIKTTVYLTNIDDFSAVNEVYAQYFTDNQPARAAVEVSRLPRNAVVEIEAIACK